MMHSSANWQMQTRASGFQCYVPVRTLTHVVTWGHIGETQVTTKGVQLPRAVFIPSKLKKCPSDYLLKLSMLKRSIAAAPLVKQHPDMHGLLSPILTAEADMHEHRTKFYSKYKLYCGKEPGLKGGDIILGINHRHYSILDRKDQYEQNGNYKPQRSIPERFTVDAWGNNVAWVAPPLSDFRSIGDWVINYTRFYVHDEMEPDDTQIRDEVVIHPVGYYYLRT